MFAKIIKMTVAEAKQDKSFRTFIAGLVLGKKDRDFLKNIDLATTPNVSAYLSAERLDGERAILTLKKRHPKLAKFLGVGRPAV